MTFIKVLIVGFLILETTNIIALYFFPDSKLANSVGVFKAWETSKQDPEIHNFTSYLVNWIAGSKLIFICLLLVILFTGNERTLTLTALALSIAIASFYWRLFPLIRKMDRDGQIDPEKYSAVLGWMILAFVLLFGAAYVLSLRG